MESKSGSNLPAHSINHLEPPNQDKTASRCGRWRRRGAPPWTCHAVPFESSPKTNVRVGRIGFVRDGCALSFGILVSYFRLRPNTSWRMCMGDLLLLLLVGCNSIRLKNYKLIKHSMNDGFEYNKLLYDTITIKIWLRLTRLSMWICLNFPTSSQYYT